MEWGQDKKYIGKIFTFCLVRGRAAGEKMQAKAGRGIFIALLLFVGIPLPGTGAWTGSLVAALMRMKRKKAVPLIFTGVVIAAILMTVITKLGIFAFF